MVKPLYVDNGAVKQSATDVAAPSPVATDSYTLHRWKMDEASGTFADSGAGANADLSTITGTSYLWYGQPGLYSDAAFFSVAAWAKSNSDVGNPSSTTLCTCHGWVKLRDFANSYPRFVVKGYTPAMTAPPYVSFDFLLNTTTGYVSLQWASGGVLKGITPVNATPFILKTDQWYHLGATMEHTGSDFVVKIYINGVLASTQTIASGVLDWNAGSSGPWSVGGAAPGGAIGQGVVTGWVFDWRFEDGVVRSAAYMKNVYQQGVGRVY